MTSAPGFAIKFLYLIDIEKSLGISIEQVTIVLTSSYSLILFILAINTFWPIRFGFS